MLTEFLLHHVTFLISKAGYFGIFVLMALESTLFPLPSELVMPFAGFLIANKTFSFIPTLIFSTFGCLFGSLISYFLGYYGGIPFIKKFGKYFFMNEHHLKKSQEWFSKKGDITIFVGRFVPGIRHVISIPAGVGKMNLIEFTLFTTFGAGIWNLILIYLGVLLEKNWTLVYHYSSYVDLLIVLLLVLAIIYFVISKTSKKAKKPNISKIIKEITKNIRKH